MQACIRLHNQRHPADMGAPDEEASRTHRAIECPVNHQTTTSRVILRMIYWYQHDVRTVNPFLLPLEGTAAGRVGGSLPKKMAFKVHSPLSTGL